MLQWMDRRRGGHAYAEARRVLAQGGKSTRRHKLDRPTPTPPTTIPKQQCALQPLRKRSDAHIRRMFVQPPLSTRSQECGDAPALNASYCSRFPRLLSRNLEAMGLTRGDVGATSGYVVSDYEPLVADGRSHHNSVALKSAAPPPVTALWKALLGRLDAADAAE